jgi:hypothetical protein
MVLYNAFKPKIRPMAVSTNVYQENARPTEQGKEPSPAGQVRRVMGIPSSMCTLLRAAQTLPEQLSPRR